jgi:hypothetical protein
LDEKQRAPLVAKVANRAGHVVEFYKAASPVKAPQQR